MHLDRLARKYLHNSSFPGAVVGKCARTILDISNAARVRRYNASIARPKLRSPETTPKLFAVCFTCGKHFEFVRLALLSLERANATIGEIFIFMDRGGALSGSQQQILRDESHVPISFAHTTYPMRAWGPKVILSQAIAYRMISEKMSEIDFLMKFDSDVIFAKDRIIRTVLGSAFGAVGMCAGTFHRNHRQDEDYMQGGCYFIRGAELARIVSVAMPESIFARTRWGAIAEDQFFTGLLRATGADIRYEDYMYSDPILIRPRTDQGELEAHLHSLPGSVDVLHFEGNQDDIVDRSNMAKTYEFLFDRPNPRLSAGGTGSKALGESLRAAGGDAMG